MVKKVECYPQFTVAFRANFTCKGKPFSPDRLDIYQEPALAMIGAGICGEDIPHQNGSFVNVQYTGNAPSKNYKLSLKTTGTCDGKKEEKKNYFDDDNVGCPPGKAKTQDFGIIAFS
uniref:ZP domain-containing protein n=1 Tax=Parastrongyloides trichosuri TaxID=131310 RepID=A0A0N4ZA83_PARTI